jgi:superfamily II DNA helicase RecQ
MRDGTTVVVSPLISLMKDQVDGLIANGVAAGQLDSSLSLEDRNRREHDLAHGNIKLLFVSPERLIHDGFQRLLRSIRVLSFAIDEAHCISHWGHDFRPEYRQLSSLRNQFPGATINAYTATATERVRGDIVAQLGLPTLKSVVSISEAGFNTNVVVEGAVTQWSHPTIGAFRSTSQSTSNITVSGAPFPVPPTSTTSSELSEIVSGMIGGRSFP